jgi:hypothetical protein
MAQLQEKFGALVTMSSTSCNMLTAGSAIGWESSAIDNTNISGGLYLDALVQLTIPFGASAPAGDKAIYIYSYGALSGSYPNPITGSQGLVTAGNAVTGVNLRSLYTITVGTSSQLLTTPPLSVALSFGGVLPPKWGLVVLNDAGGVFMTGTSVAIKWKGCYVQSV